MTCKSPLPCHNRVGNSMDVDDLCSGVLCDV